MASALRRLATPGPRSSMLSLAARSVQARCLNIHEYQAFEVLKDAGLNIPRCGGASSAEDAVNLAKSIGEGKVDYVVKAQVHAGGRGLGVFESGLKGGVQKCNNLNDVRKYASLMLGNKLITKQTGGEGRFVSHVYVAERIYMRREMYLAFTMDRKHNGPVMIGSPMGGMDIEAVAESNPEAMFVEAIDINQGIQREQARRMAENLGFGDPFDNIDAAADEITKLYNLFISKDCTLVEINPFVETPDGAVMCCDCKLNFDDNALYRHEDISALRDPTQEDPREVRAAQFDLNYIGLDGNIGCMVNGAGLAMSTMDIIQLNGGSPANFLDVGGGASERQVAEAFKILNDDAKVNVILVNIFGGIMRCDILAMGIIKAAQEIGLRVPIVVRLQGTKVEEAKKILEESAMKMIATDDLDDAASKAVQIANMAKMADEMHLKVNFEIPL